MRNVVIALVVVALAGCGGAADSALTVGPGTTGDAGRTADVAGGRTAPPVASTHCVEDFSAQTLRNRAYALDGTVTDIRGVDRGGGHAEGPFRVTFEVHQWFAGGDGDTVTLLSETREDDVVVSSASEAPVAPGSRLLVSGDADMVWGCGFTRTYSAAEAAQWEAAFAG